MMRKKPAIIFFVVLLVAAAFLRFWKLSQRSVFDFDQETLAWSAKRILVDKDPPLLGMKAGPVDVFIGPGMYYIYSFVYFFSRMDPIGANIFAVLMGLITMSVLFYTAKVIYSVSEALIASLIYAFSFVISGFDRLAWLLAPIMLISLLIILLSYLFMKRKEKIFLYLLLFVLGFSFHSHFTALFYYFIVLLYFLWCGFPKLTRKDILLSLLILIFWFSPLIVFELKYDFLNTKGVIKLFSTVAESTNYFNRFKDLWRYTLENQARIFFSQFYKFNKLSTTLTVIPLVFLLTRLFDKKENFLSRLFFLFIIFPILAFLFYPGNVPEYYFILNFPVLILISSRMIVYFYRRFCCFRVPLILFLTAFPIVNFQDILKDSFPAFSLVDKKAAVKFIINHASRKPFNYDFSGEMGFNTGFEYLFYYFKNQPSKQNEDLKYTIVVPADYLEKKVDFKAGNIGVIINEEAEKH